MADDGYTTVFQTTDATQGGLVVEMLRGEGIDARFHSVSSTLIGLHAGLVEMAVTVPLEALAQARELLADLEYVGAAEAADHGHDVEAHDDDDGAEPTSVSRWRALTRAAFTLFLPGTVHLYADRPWTALVLGLAAAWGLAGAVAAESGSSRFAAAVATIVMIVICDMIGGVRATGAALRGVRATFARQVVAGVGLVAIAGLLGFGISKAIAAPGLWRAHVLERFNLTCTQSGVMVENGDTSDRDLLFHRLGVAAPLADGTERIYDARLPNGSVVRVTAGASARVPFVLDETRAAFCARGGRCRVVFDVTLAATDRGPLPLHARGECTPGWGATSDEVPARLTPIDVEPDGE
jgi:hypothetical protein